MSYLPELHRCAWCKADLGAENGDGTCAVCDAKLVACGECSEMRMPGAPCGACEQFEAYGPAGMSQEALVKLGEVMLDEFKHQHPPGSYERAAYDASLGLLGTFPHQPWWKRLFSRGRKRRAERAMRILRSVVGEGSKA